MAGGTAFSSFLMQFFFFYKKKIQCSKLRNHFKSAWKFICTLLYVRRAVVDGILYAF